MYNMYIVQYTYININIYLYYLSNPLFSISYVSLSFHPPQLKTLLAGSPETGQPWKFPQESWHYIHEFMCIYIYTPGNPKHPLNNEMVVSNGGFQITKYDMMHVYVYIDYIYICIVYVQYIDYIFIFIKLQHTHLWAGNRLLSKTPQRGEFHVSKHNGLLGFVRKPTSNNEGDLDDGAFLDPWLGSF